MHRPYKISIQALYDYKGKHFGSHPRGLLISIQALYDYKKWLLLNWLIGCYISIQALYDYKIKHCKTEDDLNNYFNSSIVRL